MKKGTLILMLALLLGVGASCAKQSLKTTYDRQAGYIESFVSARMQTDTNATLVRKGNAYRLTLHDTLDRVFGQRDSLRVGGKVSLYYACFLLTGSTLSSSNLVSTNVRSIARQASWELTDTTRFKLDTLTLDRSLVTGLYQGLEGVKPYDECIILFTGEFGFGNIERGTIPARSALAYQFWIENVENEK